MRIVTACVSYDVSPLPTRERFDAWREFNRGPLDIVPSEGWAAQPFGRAEGWRIGRGYVGRYTTGALGQARESRRARAMGAGFVLLRIERGTRKRLLVEDDTFATRSGELYLVDMGRRMRAVAEHGETVSVMLPYDAVGYDPSRHPGWLRLSGAPRSRLLASAFDALLADLTEPTAASAFVCPTTRLDDLTLILRSILAPGSLDEEGLVHAAQAQRRAMRTYVLDHLDDPQMGIDRLRLAFATSRATIYRAFEADGGLQRFLTEHRLRAAARALATGPKVRGRIGSVARWWGFHDPGRFNRLFRRHLGMSPTEALMLSAVSEAVAKLRLNETPEPATVVSGLAVLHDQLRAPDQAMLPLTWSARPEAA